MKFMKPDRARFINFIWNDHSSISWVPMPVKYIIWRFPWNTVLYDIQGLVEKYPTFRSFPKPISYFSKILFIFFFFFKVFPTYIYALLLFSKGHWRTHGAPYRGYGYVPLRFGGGGGTSLGEWEHNNIFKGPFVFSLQAMKSTFYWGTDLQLIIKSALAPRL